MMKKHIFALILTLVMVFSLCACGGSNSNDSSNGSPITGETEAVTYSWKLSHGEVAGGYQDTYAHLFADALSELSDGAIDLQIFTLGQLAEGSENVEMCQSGAVEFVITDQGWIATMVPLMGILSLQYLQPTDIATAVKVAADESFIGYLEPYFEQQNLKLSIIQPSTFSDWSANKLIDSPDDWQGVRVRTMGSEIIQMGYQAYGANTTTITFSELYSALQLGMVDAQANSFRTQDLNKFYEVQDYAIRAKQEIYTNVMVSNLDFWNGLPADIQEIVSQATAQAAAEYAHVFDEMDGKSIDVLKDSGMEVVVLSDEQIAPFKAIAETTYSKFVDMCGQEGQELLDIYLTAKANAGA